MLAGCGDHFKTRYWQNLAAGARCSAWKITKVKQKRGNWNQNGAQIQPKESKIHEQIDLELWRETNDCQITVSEPPPEYFSHHFGNLVDVGSHFDAHQISEGRSARCFSMYLALPQQVEKN